MTADIISSRHKSYSSFASYLLIFDFLEFLYHCRLAYILFVFSFLHSSKQFQVVIHLNICTGSPELIYPDLRSYVLALSMLAISQNHLGCKLSRVDCPAKILRSIWRAWHTAKQIWQPVNVESNLIIVIKTSSN